MMQEVKKTFSKIGFTFTIFIVSTLLAQLIAGVIIALLSQVFHLDNNMNVTMMVSNILMYLIGFPLFYLLIYRIPKGQPIEKKKWKLSDLAIAFFIGVSTLYIGNIIGNILMFLGNQIFGTTFTNVVAELLNELHPVVIFILMIVIAPIMEELMFRKILIDHTIQYGEGVSILASGILFGLAHGNFYQFFYAFALGIVFAYVYVRTGQVKYTIAFHMMINCMGSMFPLLLLKLIAKSPIVGSLVTVTYGLFIIALVIMGIVLLVYNRKRISIRPLPEEIPKKTQLKTAFGNWGMICYFAVSVVMFVLNGIA